MGNLKFSEQDVEALYERAVAHNGNLSATARDAGLNRGCVR